jgi:hypothetical protein
VGKTFKHTIAAKFRNGLLAAKDAPLSIIKMWDRHNWDVGEFRAKKKALTEKIINKLNKNHE